MPRKDEEGRKQYDRERAQRPDVKAKRIERMRAWRAANPDRVKAALKRYYDANREKVREYQLAHYHKHGERYRKAAAERAREKHRKYPHLSRARWVKKEYGITIEEYEQRFIQQGGRCAACSKQAEQERYGVLCIDHDHNTGAIRGLLCRGCNTALGATEDDPLRLVRYLQRVQMS